MRYFNTSRSPLPLSLPGNRSVSVPGRGYIELDAAEVGSESVQAALASNQLRRLPDLGAIVEETAPECAAPELRFPGVSYDVPPLPPPPADEGPEASEDFADEVTRG